MKKIKYIVVLTALLLIGGFVQVSTLHAETNGLTLEVMGTLLIKKTTDVNNPSGIVQTALTGVHLSMEYNGTPVMSAITLHQRINEVDKGVGHFSPPNLTFELYNSSLTDNISAGEVYVHGANMGIEAYSNPFSVVVFNDEIPSALNKTKGVTTPYSAGSLECGGLSSSECYISYEPENPEILQVNEHSGEFVGLRAGNTDIITKVTVPSVIPYTKEVGRTAVSIEEGTTPDPTPPADTTNYSYEPGISSLEDGYVETKIGSVKIENSQGTIDPATCYYDISDPANFRIDNQGFVYVLSGLGAGDHSFTIRIYEDTAKTTLVKTLSQIITVTPANTPNPNPTPDPDVPTPDASWIDMPSIPSTGWFTKSITLNRSAVQTDFTQLSVNDGEYSPSFTLDTNGVHMLAITFKNPMTNEVTSPIHVTIKIDKEKPVIEEIKQSVNDDKKFTILASDALSDPSISTSGLEKIQYTIYQVLSNTEKNKLEEKEVNAGESIDLTTTATGNIEICAVAKDAAGLSSDPVCTDFEIKKASDTTKVILEADNALGKIEIHEGLPEGTKFNIQDVTKDTVDNELFDNKKVQLTLRMSLGSFSLKKDAKIEIPLSKDILALENKEYYIKKNDGTLVKLDAQVIDDKLVFETNSMGDLFIITPNETIQVPSPQTPSDGETKKDQVNGNNGSRTSSGISTGDMTSIGIYFVFFVSTALAMSVYLHQKKYRK